MSQPVISRQAVRPALTDQQARAVETRGLSVVLSSGAGCGKTKVLTERYLSHLRDGGADVGSLVAVTFTDRAARQMRDRIRKAVRGELHAAGDDAAAGRWAEQLRGLETAQISTIHSFCGSLLRQHAVAAELDPRFEVLDQPLAANVRSTVIRDALLGMLTAKTEAGRDLQELVVLYGWARAREAAERLATSADPRAWAETLDRDLEQIAADWQDYARTEFLPAYVNYLTAANAKVAGCLTLLRSTPCFGPKMKARVDRLLTETPRLSGARNLAATVEELKEAAKVMGTEGAKAWADQETYERVKAALDGFRKELGESLAVFLNEPADLAESARMAQRFLRVAAECDRAYRVVKNRNATLDFQDLLVRARDLLRDRADVREQLRRRFKFILIDELQDTDPVQMDLVELLCGGGMAGGKLFAVGDAKQSIYRFRGAEVTLFEGLRDRMSPDGRQDLSVNFRSQPQLIRFVNALLRELMSNYEPLQPHRDQVTAGPCVEFLWTKCGPKERVAESRRREAERIARRVAGMIAGRERLVVDETTKSLRQVQAGDVVLLFRSMTAVAAYETALRAAGLDYYLVGGRAFFAQQEIYDVLNLLRALENPQDQVSLVGTLRSPLGCLSDETIYRLAGHSDGVWAGLHDEETLALLPQDQRAAAVRVRGFLDRWRAVKDRLPIAGLLNRVLADCGFDAAQMFETLGDRKLANLWKLIDLARAFDRSGMLGLADFIRQLGESVASQPREEQAATAPEDADVIRLMSIHQAKGLEFPVVVLADLAAKPGGSHQPIALWDRQLGAVARPPADEDPPPFSDFPAKLWAAREEIAEWHEDLRTLYVACTRAKDYLILSASLPRPVKPTNTFIATLMDRFDLDTGRCLDESIPDTERPIVRVNDAEGPGETIAVRKRPRTILPPTAADAQNVRPIACGIP